MGIRFRWDPLAVEYLMDLGDQGLTEVSQRILSETRERLSLNPGICRFVRITGVPLARSRRLTEVQRLLLGSKLPYLVYYRYRKAEGVVEILRIRHSRQKPLELLKSGRSGHSGSAALVHSQPSAFLAGIPESGTEARPSLAYSFANRSSVTI